jgi:hypothetical protein
MLIEGREWKLVPVEPTEAMIDAYFDRCRDFGFTAHINATAAYITMLAASPTPPVSSNEAALVEALKPFERVNPHKTEAGLTIASVPCTIAEIRVAREALARHREGRGWE